MKMVHCYEDSEYVHIVTEKYSGGELFDKIVETPTVPPLHEQLHQQDFLLVHQQDLWLDPLTLPGTNLYLKPLT